MIRDSPEMPWHKTVCSAESLLHDRSALRQLRDGQCAVLVIKNLLTEEESLALKRRIKERQQLATVTRYSNGALTTIGPYLAKHLQSPGAYFNSAQATDVLFPDPGCDLRLKLRCALQRLFDLRSLEILREPDGRVYAPAVVRLHADGVSNPLHNDHIRRDSRNMQLKVSGLLTQFSCIACVQECDSGGELISYRRRWEPEDERFKIIDGLGYDRAVVRGYPRICFKPQTGDVYVINPTHYHEINQVAGRERITIGFFFGSFHEDMNAMFAWS